MVRIRLRDISIVIISVISGQMEASVGCGCFKQGPISVNIRIPKSGFVSGEVAKVDVKVSFKSSVYLSLLASSGSEN